MITLRNKITLFFNASNEAIQTDSVDFDFLLIQQELKKVYAKVSTGGTLITGQGYWKDQDSEPVFQFSTSFGEDDVTELVKACYSWGIFAKQEAISIEINGTLLIAFCSDDTCDQVVEAVKAFIK